MADARRFKALSMVPPLADEVARQIEAAGGDPEVRAIAEEALLTADQAIIDAAAADAKAVAAQAEVDQLFAMTVVAEFDNDVDAQAYSLSNPDALVISTEVP